MEVLCRLASRQTSRSSSELGEMASPSLTKMIALRPCDDLKDKAQSEATALLSANPNLKCIMAICSPAVPGAAEAVRTLAGRGVRLGVISNTGRTPGVVLRRFLERHGLLRHFEVVTFSDELGLRKPEAEIFRRTLAKLGPELGLEPHEVAHIGDNPQADVEGARAVGMRTVHYAVGGQPGAAHADLVIADLTTLAERLAVG